MSFRDIGVIINKAKLQAERERGYPEDEEPKSPESQAFKLFSEGKSPVEVAISLDLNQLTVYGHVSRILGTKRAGMN